MEKKTKKNAVKEWIIVILWALLIALVIRTFIIEPFRIPTQSLYPNLLSNDQILVNKIVYGVKLPFGNVKLPAIDQPKRGNIVVFQNPRYQSPGFFLNLLDFLTLGAFGIDQHPIENPKNFVKRCIGIPGDKIEWLDDREIKINGETIQKSEKIDFNYNDYPYNWAKSSYIKEVDMYKETLGDNSYYVQYVSGKTGSIIEIPKTYYMPKKGDILIIKRKSPSSPNLEYKINEIDIKDLWETKNFNMDKIQKVEIRGLKEAIEEESGLDLSKNNLLKLTSNDKEFTYEIKHGYYFMIGDNRDNSEDGRFFGPVRDNLIIGAPLFRFWPFNRFGGIDFEIPEKAE